MNFKPKLLIILVCIVFLMITLFGSVIAAEKTYNIRLATYFASDHAAIIALNDVFKPMVEEKTNGNVKINIFDNCQLGAEIEFTESVRGGSIEMAIFGNMLENTIPALKILQQPFVFRGADHLLKVLNGEVGQQLLGGFKDVGVLPLAGFTQGEVHLANNKRAVRTLEDAKGIRVRVWEGKSIIEAMKAIGIAPTAMALTEVYTSLQQGIVDGVPNTILNYKNMGWADQLKYITKMTVMVLPNYYVVNKKFFESLPEEYQNALKESAIESAKYTMKILADKEAATEKILEEEFGIEIITLSDEEKIPFKEATQVVLDDFSKEYPWATELFEAIDNVK